MRKILLSLLCAAMTMSLWATSVGELITVDGVQYKVTSMTAGQEEVFVTAQEWTSTSLVIPAKVTYSDVEFLVKYIDQYAFQDNTALTSVDVAAQEIRNWAFKNCSNLANVTLREGVKAIYREAFEGIPATSITLPASLVDLDEYGPYCPFTHNHLTEFVVAEGNPHLVVGEDGALYNKEMTHLYAFPANYPQKFKEILPTIEYIHSEAFASSTNIADTITLPATLKKAAAFHGSAIKCVILESNSPTLGNAFQGCGSIKEIIIGKNVNRIGSLMFYRCSAVRKITVLSQTMPVWAYGTDEGWPSFAENGDVFAECKVYVPCGQSDDYAANTNKWANFTNIIDTLLYTVDVEVENATYAVEKLSACNEVEVTVTPNDGYTFVNWSDGNTDNPRVLEVTSDTTVTANIKKNLVAGDLFRANTVEGVSVLYKVLTNAAGDKTVQVGDYSTYARPNAIASSTTGVVTIPDSAVYFDEKFEVVQVAEYAFYDCFYVTTLNLPNTIKEIKPLGVSELTGLTTVNVPNTLERTGRYNFAYMNSMKSITLPNTIKYIDYGTFFNCGQLETINGWDPAKIERMGASTITSATPKIWSNADYVQSVDGFRYMGDILITMPNSETITIAEGARVVTRSATGIPACKNMEIPSTVQALSSGIIFGCPLLETCTIKAVTPPLIYNAYDVSREENANWLRAYYASTTIDWGSNPTPTTVKYYVPKEGIAAYKASDKWNMLDLRPIGGWTIKFVDHDGETTQQVEQGELPILPIVEPYYTSEHMYVFDHWDVTPVVATEDVTYTAVYSEQDLPTYYVCFYATEADALAHENRVLRVEKVRGTSAVENGVTAAGKLEPRACEMVTDWNGGDLSNVTSELHVWPTWGTGQFTVVFYVEETAVKTLNNVECGDLIEAPTDFVVPAGKKFDHWDSDAWQNTDALSGNLDIHAVLVDDTTGFGNIQSATIQCTKVMIDGQLFILRGEHMYDAQGKMVK